MDLQEHSPQRRRSERVAKSLPLVVRGVDLLGQPFEERTATLNFNLHGCRYASRYHLPRNTWVTLEVPSGSEFENARARVAWIQRPHSVREFFQVSVELEAPQNLWRFEPAPQDWLAIQEVSAAVESADAASVHSEAFEISASDYPDSAGASREQTMDEMSAWSASSEQGRESAASAGERPAQSPAGGESSAEPAPRADGEANVDAVQPSEVSGQDEEHPSWLSQDRFDKWKYEFEQAQEVARDRLSGHQSELIAEMRTQFEQNLNAAKQLVAEIDNKCNALHAENEAARESASLLAQSRAEFETSRQSAETKPEEVMSDEAAERWRQRLASEMNAAQSQWNELLQSSLDGGVHRIAEQMTERVGELRQPLLEALGSAQETARSVKEELADELAHAKSVLEQMERSAAQWSEVSKRAESAAGGALDDFHGRLEMILNAQTEEMGERAEKMTADKIAQAGAEIEEAGRRTAEAATATIELQLAPRFERAAAIVRELSMKEVQGEESLRLHRERLRQVSEHSERDFASRFEKTVSAAQNDFEAARQAAAAKWAEEIDARAALASRAAVQAAEAGSRSVEEQSQARLQSIAEQVVQAGRMTLEESAADAKRRFAGELGVQSSERMGQIREHIDTMASELTGRSRALIEQAAEAAAASFGRVLRGVSDQELETFNVKAAGIAEQQREELEVSARRLLRNFETSAESSLARLHQQMTAQLETSIAEGRSALANEFNSSLASYRSDREAHEKNWAENLERLNTESAARYQERIDTACDTWVVSSVRRLNEHGQNLVESLMRSADRAVRESCAKLFDGLAEILRNQSAASGHAGAREVAEAAAAPAPSESAFDQPAL